MSDIITSRDNTKLKHARRVREGKERSFIFVEGIRLAGEAFRSGVTISEILISARVADDERIKALTKGNENGLIVADPAFETLADTDSSQGIVVIGERPTASGEMFSLAGDAPSVLLYQVNNPSNLGAVMRAAEAAGVQELFVSSGSADAFSPKALRASMGSAFRIRIWEDVDAVEMLAKAGVIGVRSAAAVIDGDLTYTDVDWTTRRLILFGSEATGLPHEMEKAVDERFLIPMAETVESLNLAVSAGVILFEAKRQRDLTANRKVFI